MRSVHRATVLASIGVGAVAAATILVRHIWPEGIVLQALVFGTVAAMAVAAVLIRMRADLARTQRHLTAEIRDMRAKQSRHEYHQERTLARVEELLSATRSDTEFSAAWASAQVHQGSGLDRVLMITTNGAGLGHLTRCLALAHKLPDHIRVDILTMSTAASVIDDPRVTIHYQPSQQACNTSQLAWERRFSTNLARLLLRLRPDAVMFDGTFIYRPVHDMLKRLRIPLIWVLRGCWRMGRETEQTEHPANFVDAIIFPDDYSVPGDFPIDTASVPTLVTSPLVATEQAQMLTRTDAISALGLNPTHRHVLIQLGAGVINDTSAMFDAAVTAVVGLGEGWIPVVVESPLKSHQRALPPHAVSVHRYPLAPCFAAFEFGVFAAGYNSVQEAISLALPTVLVPNEETVTDDQGRRARGAHDRGFALQATSVGELTAAIEALGDCEARAAMRARQLEAKDSSSDANPRIAEWLTQLTEGAPHPSALPSDHAD